MFTKGQSITLVAAVVLMLIVVGCSAQQPAASTATFPAGERFKALGPGEVGEWIAEFKADGTYVLTRQDGQAGRGTFVVTGNQLKVKDLSSCNSPDKESATYSWSFDGKILNLSSSDDKCGDRWRIMSLIWTKQ